MSSSVLSTPLEEIPQIRSRLRAGFASGRSRDIEYRRTQLAALAYLLKDNRDQFYDALTKDLHRSSMETELFELVPVIDNVLRARDNVRKWAKPERAAITLNTLLVRPVIYKESKGTTLIVGPGNYPLYCNILPLVGAIAAGCAAVVKPSEHTPCTTALLTELFPKYLDPEMYAVVNGAVPEMKTLLDLQWDHIFFTGSTNVGRIVAKAAAEHLTPVSLELGGKNPAIVDKDVDVDATARKILWAKAGNSGQTCIVTDFVMVHRDIHAKFVAALVKAYNQFWPDAESMERDHTHLIRNGAYKRITELLQNTKGNVVAGGGLSAAVESTHFVPTTIVDKVSLDDVLMEHEIFGPILPIVPVDSVEEAVAYMQKRESPLAYYIYSNSHKVATYVRENSRSGMFLHNDAVVQGAFYGSPFGGVGPSGYGAQGGKFTFDLFVYFRGGASIPSIMEKILAFRYPPYTSGKMKFMTSFLSPRVNIPRPGQNSTSWGKVVASLTLVIGIITAYRLKALPTPSGR